MASSSSDLDPQAQDLPSGERTVPWASVFDAPTQVGVATDWLLAAEDTPPARLRAAEGGAGDDWDATFADASPYILDSTCAERPRRFDDPATEPAGLMALVNEALEGEPTLVRATESSADLTSEGGSQREEPIGSVRREQPIAHAGAWEPVVARVLGALAHPEPPQVSPPRAPTPPTAQVSAAAPQPAAAPPGAVAPQPAAAATPSVIVYAPADAGRRPRSPDQAARFVPVKARPPQREAQRQPGARQSPCAKQSNSATQSPCAKQSSLSAPRALPRAPRGATSRWLTLLGIASGVALALSGLALAASFNAPRRTTETSHVETQCAAADGVAEGAADRPALPAEVAAQRSGAASLEAPGSAPPADASGRASAPALAGARSAGTGARTASPQGTSARAASRGIKARPGVPAESAGEPAIDLGF